MKPALDLSQTVTGWHFTASPTQFRGGRAIPPDGRWLIMSGEPEMCSYGLHFSVRPLDALGYAPGSYVYLVEAAGVVTDTDKCVAQARRIIARADAEAVLRAFARRCALDVAHLWSAPPVVLEYLRAGDEAIRAAARAVARDAAWDAARAAAWDAARAAAWDVARDAAWDAARDAQNTMLDEMLREVAK